MQRLSDSFFGLEFFLICNNVIGKEKALSSITRQIISPIKLK